MQSVKPSFRKYAAAFVELDVTGKFLAYATDFELSNMFEQMNVSAVHKAELRAAVAGWRAAPQQVRRNYVLD